MLKCKDVSELVSQGLDRRLSWTARVQIKLHLLICKNCQHYLRQLIFLHSAIGKLGKQSDSTHLSPQAKQRITRALDKHSE